MTRKKTDEPLEAWPRVPLWGSTSHTPPVKEGVNPVGLQHSNFQTMREIVLLYNLGPNRCVRHTRMAWIRRSIPREVNVFVDNAAV